MSDRTKQTITAAVYQFLYVRDVQNFKVFTIECELRPVVLVQAEPQKKLRFSNILESQIKKMLAEKHQCDVEAVFWRFKSDVVSGHDHPEQVDYEEEKEPVLQKAEPVPSLLSPAPKTEPHAETLVTVVEHDINIHNYNITQLADKIEVSEIHHDEFELHYQLTELRTKKD